MTDKERALLAVEALEKKYPDAICSLNAMNPLQLLIATRLSAQCTDARVNLVTPALFEKYKTAEDFAAAAPEEVETLIRSCGFSGRRQGTSSECAARSSTISAGRCPIP